ncbi:MAG TPA: hypothetical protein VNL71_06595 [Chloroflexota bacterium]|nr:hypothetical protein [Chloroflexota bacterium]
MPEASPAPRALARYVLLHAAGDHPEPEALAVAAEQAAERLRGRLADLIGLTGYTILVARAVRLARADIPALEGVTVDTDAEGALYGVREFALASGDSAVAAAGLSAILDHIIGLLITFIGEDLAIRLIREAWPELAHGPVESEGQR